MRFIPNIYLHTVNMPWLLPQISAGPSLTWPSCVKIESVFTGTCCILPPAKKVQKSFGATAKLVDLLYAFVHHVSPQVKQQGTHLSVNIEYDFLGAF